MLYQSRQVINFFTMKISYITFVLLLVIACFNLFIAQVKVGAWEIHEGNEGVIDFATPDVSARKAAFEKAKIPAESDPKWETARTKANGTVDYPDLGENVKSCAKQVDFTYFQTHVFVPDNVHMQNFTVSYDKADDGARIYIFNDKNTNGSFDERSDLILNQSKYQAADLKGLLAKGENRLVIVQYNQCIHNSIMGIRSKVDSKEIPPAVLPRKFSLHAYSINGKRVEKGSDYWMGFIPSEKGPRIPGRILSAKTGTVMEIEREDVDIEKGLIALKVVNGPDAGSFLTIQDDNSVKVMQYPSNNARTQFKIRPPEENGASSLNYVSCESVWRPNHFLRHEGYVLKVSPATESNRQNVVYRQDASWLFEPTK